MYFKRIRIENGRWRIKRDLSDISSAEPGNAVVKVYLEEKNTSTRNTTFWYFISKFEIFMWKMLDFFTIFSKGGILLWCFKGMYLDEKDWEAFTPAVNAFIKTVLLQVMSFPTSKVQIKRVWFLQN